MRINAVAPGNVRTPLTAAMGDRATAALAGLPIPINYQTGDQLLDPVDIANVLVFLVSPAAHGVNGNIMFVRRRHRRSAQQRESLLRRRNP